MIAWISFPFSVQGEQFSPSPFPRRRHPNTRSPAVASAGPSASLIVSPPAVPVGLETDVAAALGPALPPLCEADFYAAAAPLPGEAAPALAIDGNPRFARLSALLRPALLAYQRRALFWLLQREGAVSKAVWAAGR
jgi:hypothetical protein